VQSVSAAQVVLQADVDAHKRALGHALPVAEEQACVPSQTLAVSVEPEQADVPQVVPEFG